MYKILIINTVNTRSNGITNVIFNLLRAINKENFQFDLLSRNQPEENYIQEVGKYGGNLYVIPRDTKHIFRYLKSIKELIKKNKYDIVHVHGSSHTVALELYAAKKADCRVRIAHAHSTNCKSKLLHKILTRFFNKVYTRGFACGVDAGKFMFGKHEFTLIKNGVDTQRYAFNCSIREEKKKLLGLQENIVIGHVGGFNYIKNQSFLLDILKILIQKNSAFALVMLGDGALLNEVKTKSEELKIFDSVRFLGVVHNVSDYLSACDLILMPSLYEGLPLTLIEEQTNGLKCLVSDRITEEVNITGNVRFLSLEDGAEAWANEILKFNFEQDRETNSRLAINAIKLKGYDIYGEAENLRQNYLLALKENNI